MFSEPVVGEKFFGREEVLELLDKRILALKDGYRQNIALTGQSLAGKSSIILHFLRTVNSDGLIPVYVEVVREPFRSFANKFIATVLYNTLRKLGEEAEVDMDRIMDAAERVMPKTCQLIKQVNISIERGDLDEAYTNLLAVTSILKEESGLSCVVILDEFDNLEHLGIKNPFLSFGKVIMVQKDTMYIVSSSRNEAIKKILSEKLSLLFGNFEVVRISNFNAGTASKFIDVKFTGFEVIDDIKRFLIMLTDGNPFYLGRICQRARQAAEERGAVAIDEDVIASAVLDLVYHANGVIHQYLMNYILTVLDSRCLEFQVAILTAIAEGHNTQFKVARGLKTKQGDISKAIARLVDSGVLVKNGIFYGVADNMLAFWIKSVYQRRRDLLIDGTFNRMELFRRDIRVYMSDYIREYDKPAAQRIAEMFNAFSNELVSIDGKNIRLPHFTKVEIKQSQDSGSMIAASFRGSFWMAQVHDRIVNENDVVNYIKSVKVSGCKVNNKIIIAFRGTDENAKLLAKELKISIWDSSVANRLFNSYGLKRMVVL